MSGCSSSCCCGAGKETEVKQALETWLKTVATGSAEAITKLYADDAVLLPTLMGKVCDTPALRLEYFNHFAAKIPNGKIDEIRTRVFGDIAINSGHYTFTFKDGSSAAARFSFAYKKTEKGWMIIDHHSSLLPAGH